MGLQNNLSFNNIQVLGISLHVLIPKLWAFECEQLRFQHCNVNNLKYK